MATGKMGGLATILSTTVEGIFSKGVSGGSSGTSKKLGRCGGSTVGAYLNCIVGGKVNCSLTGCSTVLDTACAHS